jgi:hypothetical protein
MLPGGLWFAIHAARGSLPTYPGDGAGRLLAGLAVGG